MVGVQEPERNTRKLADLLGWYASPQAHVISRFPVLDPPDADGLFAYVMPVPGRVVAVSNVHLPSTPYGPYQVRKGWPRSKVLELERTLRLPALHRVLRELPALAEQMPVFLTGDFNSPSHLDWTQAVADSRREVPYAVAWPASKALAEAGFGDSYRDAHPDPVADPGYTWSPGGPETQDKDFFDRIDWVLHAGAATTVDSRLVGERGNPQVDLRLRQALPDRPPRRRVDVRRDPWPGADARLSRAASRLRRRPPLRSASTARAHPTRWSHSCRAVPRRRCCRRVSTDGRTDGVVRLDKSGLRPGRYDVVLVDRATGAVDARAPVWVYAARRATAAADRRAVVRRRREHPGRASPVRRASCSTGSGCSAASRSAGARAGTWSTATRTRTSRAR